MAAVNKKHNENKPLVSVIMVVFNEKPDILEAAIKSVLNQDYENIELIVADDSTCQRTVDMVDTFDADERVLIIRQNGRMGLSHSRNICLEVAKGDYIAIMDGDDISLRDRITKQVFFLEEHKKTYVLGGQINIINEESNRISFRRYPTSKIGMFFFSAVRCPVAHPTVMMRRKLIDIGFRYDEHLEMSEDLDLWLRVMNHGYKVTNLNSVVLNYRIGKNFIERRTSRKQLGYMVNVRRNNFCWKHLLHSVLSCVSAWVLFNMPIEMLNRLYRRENGKGVKGN